MPTPHTTNQTAADGSAVIRPNRYRTHTCGELRDGDVGQTVRLAGWVRSVREHGNALFVDLRDRWGITQIVFDPEHDAARRRTAAELRREWVIQVEGVVRPRGPERENPKLETGQIEVQADSLNVLSQAKTPPIEIRDGIETGEEVRLTYRFLDLRRPEMQRALETRARAIAGIHAALVAEGFVEVETPMLGKSTPEGARDFLVPSRLDPGTFFALPQSPQMYKQLLMIAGLDRYYQIARCVRDEDLRADRQFEFTQLDVEMSFATRDDILGVTERAIAAAFQAGIDYELPLPLPRYTHRELMDTYGSDRPDLRFDIKLGDLTEMAQDCGFNVFRRVAADGGVVKGLAAPGWAAKSRGEIDKLTNECKDLGAKGLAWMKLTGGALTSNIVKMFTEAERAQIVRVLGADDGALLLFQSGPAALTNKVLAFLRERVGTENGLKKPGVFQAYFNVDFPAFVYSAEAGRWVSEHHPFTGIIEADLPLLDSGDPGDLARVRSTSYDLVINGYECASGSIRIHRADVQEKVFQVLQHSPADIRRRFGFFIDALAYGTPPHAGIAAGIDRLLMLMLGRQSIRDVIAFPKSQRGADLMSGAPDTVDPKQLQELNVRIVETEEDHET